MSNAPRFGGANANESDAFLGPGYYEQKSQFAEADRAKANISHSIKGANMQLVNGIPQKSQTELASKNQNFLTSAPRFAQAEQGKKPVVNPGPGHYAVENANGWFKRSYNMNFSEM